MKNNKNTRLSKFHNKTKLLVNCLIRFFTKDNLDHLQLPPKLSTAVFEFVDKVRITGVRLTENNTIKKTDVFNNSHLRLLFFKMKEELGNTGLENLELDKALHKTTLDLDLSPES